MTQENLNLNDSLLRDEEMLMKKQKNILPHFNQDDILDISFNLIKVLGNFTTGLFISFFQTLSFQNSVITVSLNIILWALTQDNQAC